MRPAPTVDKEDDKHMEELGMYTDNTVAVVTVEYFNMKCGRMVKSNIALEDYERMTAKYEEDADFWKKHGIEAANDFVRLVLSRQ